MKLVIDLADRVAIRETYGDCQKWRKKGRVLRGATPPDYKPLDPSSLIPDTEWKTLLELGCGLEGWITGFLDKAADSAVIYACDLNDDVLRNFSIEFAENSVDRTIAHRCVVADGETLPFADNSFDSISAVFVGHHMTNADEFIAGLARVLKPEGWLLTNSLVWSNPPPDFPSQALQRLLGEPSGFVVLNAFDASKARAALSRYFTDVQDAIDVKSATLRNVADLVRLHSRQEHFIARALTPDYTWEEYLECVSDIASEYLISEGSYRFELPITYFIARGKRDITSDVK